jgi:hypothetical protein
MYIGVIEAIKELNLNIEILTLEDIPDTYNTDIKMYDFFKIPKELFNNAFLFDNTPYSKAIEIIKYINSLRSNLVFALAIAGFTANNFLNKFDLLYIYLTKAIYYDNDNNGRNFPTAIICNKLNSLSSDYKKKENISDINSFRNKNVLSTTDVSTILKYFDIKKDKIIKLSDDFYGGILIKNFSNIPKDKIIKKYKDFAGILKK